MTKVFCIQSENEWELFMTLNGMAEWLNAKKPIDGKFYVLSGIQGQDKTFYDITAPNLDAVMKQSEQEVGLCADIRILQDFVLQDIETRYILSTINVND